MVCEAIWLRDSALTAVICIATPKPSDCDSVGMTSIYDLGIYRAEALTEEHRRPLYDVRSLPLHRSFTYNPFAKSHRPRSASFRHRAQP